MLFRSGCAGAFLAHYMHFLHPNMFTMAKSDELIIVVILGGRGSLTGTILAGLLLLPLPELLRFGSAEQWRMVFYGLLVVLAILFSPSGLMGPSALSWRGIKNGVRKLGAALKRRTDVRKGGR